MNKATQEEKISQDHYTKGREIERSSKRFMRAMITKDKPLKILDIGCGTGLNAEFLRKMGHEVIGIDLSSEAIKKFTAAGFEGYVQDIEQGLPFSDGTFDLVYASEVIEHLADTAAFLNETNRVLNNCGQLLLSTPNSAFWVYRLYALMGRTLSEVQHPGHIRFFSRESLTQALSNANFALDAVSARHMYFIISEPWGKIVAPLLKAIGGERELRFKTNTYFWQISRFTQKAGNFWADTLIVRAHKT